MKKDYFLPYCSLEFINCYAVVTCDEGVNIDFKEVKEIEPIIKNVVKERKIGLIANRKNQYSVNPEAINKLFSNNFLVAGAIVGTRTVTKLNAEIEALMISEAPIKFFWNISDAIKWVELKVLESSNELNR